MKSSSPNLALLALACALGLATTPALAQWTIDYSVRYEASGQQTGKPGERRKPDLIKATRKRRITAGAGVQVQEVNRLLNQFEQMQGMMKKMKGGGLMKMMKRMGGGAFPR